MDVINDADNIGMKIANENLKSSARNAQKTFKTSEICQPSPYDSLFNCVFYTLSCFHTREVGDVCEFSSQIPVSSVVMLFENST